MAKKTGIFALAAGVAAGAAALFLSKKENREMAKKGLTKAATTAKKEVKVIKQQGKKLAAKAVKTVRKVSAKPASKPKKVARKPMAKRKK